MTERPDEFVGLATERPRPERARSRATDALFAIGVAVVAANSALYFFGVESLSHPAVSLLVVPLVAAFYLRME